MNKKLARLSERRQQLVAQAAAQRTALAQNLEPWRTPLALADKGLAAVRYVKQRPALIIGAVALFGMLRPIRVGKWLQGGLAAFQMVRSLRSLLPKS